MKRSVLCLLLLLALLLTGCAHPTAEEPTVSKEPQYLTRINFYSNGGSLLDQFRIEYDPTGIPVKISSGIQEDQRFESPLGGAPVLPEGVKLDQTDAAYHSILLAPCDGGTALLVAGTAQEPLWGMVLNGSDYSERNGYLTKVTAGDGSYVALFYSTISDAFDAPENTDETSFAVTENSACYGYDAVLTALGSAIVAAENDEPATLNELLFSPLYATEPKPGDIGYTFVDLDSNGIMEMLVGSKGQFARSTIYNLYAIYNGRIVNVLSSTDSARYTMTAANEILLDTKNDADKPVFAIYSYYITSLRLTEAVIQDGRDRFRTTQNFNDDSAYESISTDEAKSIEDAHKAMEIEFTPLNDFIESAGLRTPA